MCGLRTAMINVPICKGTSYQITQYTEECLKERNVSITKCNQYLE